MRITAIKIIQLLRDNGFEAYFAGGCVRDMLLEIHPKDFDIATSATPDQIQKLIPKTLEFGKSFGVITAIVNDHHFEIATFRSDSGYSDGRRPDAVIFTSAKEDASRRDFTINALFYDPIADKVIDYVDGQKDLDEKMIRFIGDPNQRILEDHLRILRAIRFKNTFDFRYHPETYNAIKKHAALITKISKERIRDEIIKMMSSQNLSQVFEDLSDTGILQHIIPELEKMKGVAQPIEYHQEGDVWEHTMLALSSLKLTATLDTKFAVLFHDIGKPDTFKVKERIRFDGHCEKSAEIAQEILSRLRFSKKMTEDITWLVKHHMLSLNITQMNVGRRRHWFLHEDFLALADVFYADAMGSQPLDLRLYNQVMELYRHDLEHVSKVPEPLLTGEEIMKELKIKPGEKIGEILDELRLFQLAKKIKTKIQAIEWLAKFKI
ncbi:MAG: tRNA nucleotidyltransferase/poly(A) polymerase, poly(A) polymerase [Candidatus Peregrinibacteria bacterium GW2011_GWF2_38_29]|nr:MAG: tRNA nucleotidyltransferase/poly(A) polymerase, poly(A) polymerase [Candidatus Peregrinibacteria bacterium GW2011_GWF2_38_29]HBB02584.1 phosphohydrolase [Candidatus Peregrinibacteria bacterium]